MSNAPSPFQTLINSETPVLVDFYADWCQPCKILAPILQNIAGIVGDNVKIIKVNVDKNPAAANAYAIRGVPTLILFRKGEIKWRQSGVVPQEELLKVLKRHF